MPELTVPLLRPDNRRGKRQAREGGQRSRKAPSDRARNLSPCGGVRVDPALKPATGTLGVLLSPQGMVSPLVPRTSMMN